MSSIVNISQPIPASYTPPEPKLRYGLNKPFPAEWGEPPEIETRDWVELPDGYGNGSSTLKKWIESHLCDG